MSLTGKIRTIDMGLIDDLFEMKGGYVLNFTDRTFSEFFEDELGVNIKDPQYEIDGTSKAKRLRFFLRNCDPKIGVRALLALWEYREDDRRGNRREEKVQDAKNKFYSLIERLGGERPTEHKKTNTARTLQSAEIAPSLSRDLERELLKISEFKPQDRGYAFEKFLKNLFDANGLEARSSFRLIGEQIDGSFELFADTYLLEAKWTKLPIGVADLHIFNGKVGEKAAWSRGLFISYSGFTDDGLVAFGRKKQIICMDGLDLSDMLEKNLSFGHIVALKVRRAAESGEVFTRVRELNA